MNRPDDLRKCLNTVFNSQETPDEVIVSDDSLEGKLAQEVVTHYPKVIYQEGPHKGLGANRNACIQKAKGDYLIFIDDDVCVSPHFLGTARKIIAKINTQVIVTGYEINYQSGREQPMVKIVPHNPDFWGFQRIPINNNYRAIVINATIFPSSLFKQALFDEHLRYGSEELDMAQHAIALGYQIIYKDSLFVEHYPSPINRNYYEQFIHASRLYATVKAYWQYEKSLIKTLIYLLLAPLQLLGSAILRGNFLALQQAVKSIFLAGSYLF